MRKPAKDKWAKGWFRQRIVEERKFLWEPEYVALLARWVGFKHGQTMVDVGCGLGYLGELYWPYFGNGGRYCGVDISPVLLAGAKKRARGWAMGGTAEFRAGDAYKLPYPDGHADVVICQTLLLHLAEQQKAVNEMFRILRPGGVVLCKEPDHLAMALQHSVSSLPELPMEDRLFFQRVALISAKGRANLGLGISDTASHVLLWLKEAGFERIDAKMNSQPFLLIPPYETPKQQYDISRWRKDNRRFQNPAAKRRENAVFRKAFFAGGGTKSEYDTCLKLRRKYRSRRNLYSRQLRDGTYYLFGAKQFFAFKGSKPR